MKTIRERRLKEFQRTLELVKEIIENKEILNTELDESRNKQIQENIDDLENLATNILTYVFTAEDLKLKSNEVDVKYTKEYIYILTQIEIAEDGLNPNRMFDNPIDLVACICRNASINEKQELIHNIMHYDYVPKEYDYYFGNQTYKRTFA